MSFGGVYACETKTPIGLQRSTLTFIPGEDGIAFTGSSVSETGTLTFYDTVADGNRVTWRMDLTRPLKITLLCEGVFENDRLEAVINAGLVGKLQLTGQRTSADLP